MRNRWCPYESILFICRAYLSVHIYSKCIYRVVCTSSRPGRQQCRHMLEGRGESRARGGGGGRAPQIKTQFIPGFSEDGSLRQCWSYTTRQIKTADCSNRYICSVKVNWRNNKHLIISKFLAVVNWTHLPLLYGRICSEVIVANHSVSKSK